jgi:hypothetical protein
VNVRFLVVSLKERGDFGEVQLGGRIILKSILNTLKVVDSIDPAQNEGTCWTVVNTVMNRRVL